MDFVAPHWTPTKHARIAGVLQLLEAAAGTFGQFTVVEKLVDKHDAAATAANILANQPMYLAGSVLTVIAVFIHVAWALVSYELFKPAGRHIAAFAAALIIVGCAVQAVGALTYTAPAILLFDAAKATGFSPDQIQGLSHIMLRFNAFAFDIYLVIFGGWCVATAMLVRRSTFMPRGFALGLGAAGLAWLTFFYPPFAREHLAVIQGVAVLGEFSFAFWLILKGVDDAKWHEQAAR